MPLRRYGVLRLSWPELRNRSRSKVRWSERTCHVGGGRLNGRPAPIDEIVEERLPARTQEAFKIKLAHGGGARRLSHGLQVRAPREHLLDALRELSVRKEIHGKTVLAIAQHFEHRRRSGTYDQATRSHRLDKRPREHERVGQVHVRGGDLQQLQVRRVVEKPREVHALQVKLIADFLQHHVPESRSRWRRRAVADAVLADDHHMRAPAFAQELRQSAHEHMKAAIGFKIARDVCDDLVPAGECCVRSGQLERGVGVWPYALRVNALVYHGNARLHLGGVQAPLPPGGRMPPVGALKCQKVDAVARAQARGVVENRTELRIEVRVHAVRVVEELEIRKQRHARKHILDEERFSPAAMADDQIRTKSLLAQTSAGLRRIGARIDGAVELDRIGMAVDEAALVLRVDDLVNAGHRVFIGLREEVHTVTGLACKMSDQVAVLPGEILMNEEIIHRPSALMSVARSASSCAGCTRATAASSKSALRRRTSNSANGCCSKQRLSIPGVKPQRCAIDVRPLAIAGPKPKKTSCGVTEPAGD